jgi:ABC-type bacteriocin/lantibiotic exporter with double-glycine peptidase domain
MLLEELKLFPNGIQTELGQKGALLSGGQKQRLSIARTLIRKPQLILMDDITSAMDAVTEEKFWQKISRNYPETTMLIITHRQKTTQIANRVIHLP